MIRKEDGRVRWMVETGDVSTRSDRHRLDRMAERFVFEEAALSGQPLGKAWIFEEDDWALADLFLNMQTAAGKDWHSTLKFDLAKGKPVVQWSYGYEVVDLHAWEQAEGETNAFAAPGRSGAMVIPQDVLELRAARVKTKSRRDK